MVDFFFNELWLDLHFEAFYSVLYMKHVKAFISTYHQIDMKVNTQAINEILFSGSTRQMEHRTDEYTVSAIKNSISCLAQQNRERSFI